VGAGGFEMKIKRGRFSGKDVVRKKFLKGIEKSLTIKEVFLKT